MRFMVCMQGSRSPQARASTAPPGRRGGAFAYRGLQTRELHPVPADPLIEEDIRIVRDLGDLVLEDGEVFLLLDVVQLHDEIGEMLAHVSLTLAAPVVDPGLDLVVDVVKVPRVRRRKAPLAALAGLVSDAVIAKPRVGLKPDILSRVGVKTRDVVSLAVGGGFRICHPCSLDRGLGEYRRFEWLACAGIGLMGLALGPDMI